MARTKSRVRSTGMRYSMVTSTEPRPGTKVGWPGGVTAWAMLVASSSGRRD